MQRMRVLPRAMFMLFIFIVGTYIVFNSWKDKVIEVNELQPVAFRLRRKATDGTVRSALDSAFEAEAAAEAMAVIEATSTPDPPTEAIPVITLPPASPTPGFQGQRVHVAVVTASSSNHFCFLASLIESVRRYASGAKFVFYDLGLNDFERRWVQSTDGVEYRTFPFELYPPHFNIKVEAGEFAWKVAIIAQMLTEADTVFWMDAGDKVHSSLDHLIRLVEDKGFYSSGSQGDIRMWTHPKMLDYLKVDPSILSMPNCNGAFLGFSRTHTESLVKKWLDCAMDRDCIAPVGSNRGNHRQDQAALTILVWQSGQFRCGQQHFANVFTFHEDAWSTCANFPAMFAVGLPTNVDLLKDFTLRILTEANIRAVNVHKMVAPSIISAVYLATQRHQRPKLYLVGQSVSLALLQLIHIISQNSELSVICESPLDNSLSSVLIKDSFKLQGSTPVTTYIGPLKGKVQVANISMPFTISTLESVFSQFGQAQGLILLEPLSQSVDSIAEELDKLTSSTVLGWNSDCFIVWDVTSKSLSSDPDFFEVVWQQAVPKKYHSLLLRIDNEHYVAVLSNFVLPTDLVSLPKLF